MGRAAATLPMWGGASALCLMSGAQNEDDSYKKSIAVQMHLMAWELPDTIMVRERDLYAWVFLFWSPFETIPRLLCFPQIGPGFEDVTLE